MVKSNLRWSRASRLPKLRNSQCRLWHSRELVHEHTYLALHHRYHNGLTILSIMPFSVLSVGDFEFTARDSSATCSTPITRTSPHRRVQIVRRKAQEGCTSEEEEDQDNISCARHEAGHAISTTGRDAVRRSRKTTQSSQC